MRANVKMYSYSVLGIAEGRIVSDGSDYMFDWSDGKCVGECSVVEER